MSDSDKVVENQIIQAAEKLIDPPSSVDELLSLLDRLFLCLSEVEQSPPESMQTALSPLMKALVGGNLFKHSDIDVKVAVGACISEITRITAPDAPYDDEQMKEVFKLFVSSFEDLVDKSSRSFPKRTSILETVAKVRSCVVMLDLECDALLIEMFQHFLKAIRDHHPGNVFSSMENIMTLVLEESEDIPPEMLSPILHYVKKDDEVSQVSRRLAEQVLSNCASKLKTYLTEAVKSSGVPLNKYSNIVASICEGTFSASQQDQVVANEKEDSQGYLTREAEVEDKQKAAGISTPERTDAPKDESGNSGVSNGVAQQNDSSVDTDSTKKQDDRSAKDEPQQLDNPSNTDSDTTSEVKPDDEHQNKEKEKQPSSVKQADSSKNSDTKEETEPVALLDNKNVLTSPPDDSSVDAATSENEKQTCLALPSKTLADETANVSSPSRAEDLLEQSRPKKTANQKKKESSTKEVKPSAASATEEAPEEPNTSEAQVTKKSGKKVASSSKAKPTVPPSKKSTLETKVAKQSEIKVVESDNAQESTKPNEEKKKPGRGKAMDEEPLHTSSGDNEKPAVSSGKSASKSKKEAKQPLEETPNTDTKRKRSPDKGKYLLKAKKILPLFVATTLQIALSFMTILAEYTLNFHLPPRVLVAERMAVASVILTPLALIFERHTRPPMTFKIFILIIIMSLFEPVVEQNMYYTGLELTTATFTAAICNLLPAVTFIMACIFRFEDVAIHTRRGKAKLVGTSVAVAGALGVTFYTGSRIPLPWTGVNWDDYETRKSREHIGKGVVMLITSCMSWSAYKMIQAKLLVLYPAKLSLMALMCVLGTFESAIAALIWEGERMSVWKPGLNVTLLAILYGGCLSAAEYYITDWLGKMKGPVYLNMFNPLKLVITAIISSVAMREELYVGRILGAAIILAGISMVLWGKMRDGEQMSPADAMEDGDSVDVELDV